MRFSDQPIILKRKRRARLKALKEPGPMLAASLVRLGRRCGYKGCRCARGQKHVSFYLTLKQQGTTQTLYVPLDRLSEVKAWVKEYRRVRDLIREVSGLSWSLLKAETRIRKARKTRRR